MRILIATAVYYPQINGVAVFSHNLAVGLAKRGNEVAVVCPSQTGKNYTETIDGVKTTYLKSLQAKVYHDQIHPLPQKRQVFGVGLPKFFYKYGFRVSVFPYPEIKKVMEEFRPDVVHVQVSDAIGLSVAFYARKHGIPVVTTEHNQPEVLTGSLRMPGVVKKPINALLSSYFRNRQSKSDFVTMPTKQAIEHLLKNHEINVPVAAISNGVDLSFFRPGKADKRLYEKYGIPTDGKTALYVGRVDPEKEVELVIRAFDKVQEDIPDLKLVIVGDGVDKARLEQLSLAEGLAKKVFFLGRILPPELYEIYRLGDVFITASRIETQGIVLIEAAASGLPLIAVDEGAVAEVCQNNQNGVLCRPGNVNDLAGALKKLLLDEKLRKQYAKNSLVIAGGHDFEVTLDRFINVYNHVIKDKVESSK